MSDEIRDDESSLFEVPTSEPAEGVPGTEVADGDMNEIPKGPNHTRRNRVVVGCVAAVLVAGLGIGLALSHGAPAQEAPVAATTAAATTEQADPAHVAAILPNLTFDGQDVSIAGDLVTVGVSEAGNVVVTNASTDDAATVVSSTAMRSAALAGELGDATVTGPSGDVTVSEVTWVTTDPDGNVECGVSNDPAKAPSSGDASTVISGSKGWTMSDEAHDAAGLPAELPATGGDPVVDAGGNAVTPSQGVADAAGSAGESGSQAGTATGSDQQHQAAASQRPSGSQPSGGNGGSGSSNAPSGGSSSGASGSQASRPSHQHTWVAVTHEEPVYGQKWVSNIVYTRHEKYVCNGCGFTTSSLSAMGDHFDEAAEAGRYSCGSWTDHSYTTEEDHGHYDTVQTGTKTVTDGYRCSGCGATK